MSTSSVDDAIALLGKLNLRGEAPSHYVARHLLLSLGLALREASPRAQEWTQKAREAGDRAGERWGEAVQAELALACAEFAQCVDPRYLSLPNYDLEYTQAARARLEDRLVAARALGFEPGPRDQEILALADRVLETYRTGKKA